MRGKENKTYIKQQIDFSAPSLNGLFRIFFVLHCIGCNKPNILLFIYAKWNRNLNIITMDRRPVKEYRETEERKCIYDKIDTQLFKRHIFGENVSER